MTQDEFSLWGKQLGKEIYRGWEFQVVYPGYFAFYNLQSRWTVFCTPDWEDHGIVAIQISDQKSGEDAEAIEVPFVDPNRTPERILEIVKPWLDKYHPSCLVSLSSKEA